MCSESAFITPLQNMSIISISGEQRHDYLHGQLTVATKRFDANTARLSAHCDFKGKMFSASLLSEFEEQFLMLAENASANESLAQLKKYGVFSKVDITLFDDLAIYGAYGSAAFDLVKQLFSDVTDSHLSVCSNTMGQAVSFNDTSIRFLLYLTEKGLAHLNDIAQDIVKAAPERWEALEIEAAMGNVQAATISEFVPQMLNFQSLDAIDFDKGCYMGQEVVARTKFLGKNKRACFVLEGNIDHQDLRDSQEQLKVGSNLEIQIGDNWRRGGVINRLSVLDNKIHMLAVMANDTEVGSVVRLKDTSILLKVKPLPYSLD